LQDLQTANLEHISNEGAFDSPEQIVLQLSHRDLNLGYFKFVQYRILKLNSGDLLSVSEEGFSNTNGDAVAKYSKQFLSRIERLKKQGYSISSAKISFLVYWYDPEVEEEHLIVLPEMALIREPKTT